MKALAIFLTLSFLLFGCSDRGAETETELAIPVSVEELKLKPIQAFITATGTVIATQNATLRAEISGFYRLATNSKTGRPFMLGDKVGQNQTIIYLDNPELENNIKIESQKLNLEISEREFEKQKNLFDKGGVTLRELKTAERAFIDAKYNYDYSLIQLAKLQIKAPFAGLITDLPYYTRGNRVEVNSVLAQVMDYSKLIMELSLPGQELGRVRIGQPALVVNYTLPDDTLKGQITQVSPAIDPETRAFKAKVIIDNADLMLRPGMFVKVDVTVAQKDSAIVIPKDIILTKSRGKTVFVVEKGSASERLVETGLENPAEIEVINGLKANERLVVKGFETLRDHSKVKIIR